MHQIFIIIQNKSFDWTGAWIKVAQRLCHYSLSHTTSQPFNLNSKLNICCCVFEAGYGEGQAIGGGREKREGDREKNKK